jgi:HEPN domain-containing protein
MSESPATTIAKLLRASSDDEQAMTFPLPDSGFGFHAQQAVEKLYKVLLDHKLGKFPFSHDLLSLRKRLEAAGLQLPPCVFRLEDLSDYAGNARYDDPIALDDPTRETLRRCVADLRRFVLEEISSGYGLGKM